MTKHALGLPAGDVRFAAATCKAHETMTKRMIENMYIVDMWFFYMHLQVVINNKSDGVKEPNRTKPQTH